MTSVFDMVAEVARLWTALGIPNSGDFGYGHSLPAAAWLDMSEETPDNETTGPRSGPDVDIALFSRVQQLINSVRLIQDGRITVDTGGIASDVHIARKEFEMGHIDQAFAAVNRLSNSFDLKVGQWENAARRKELHKQNLSMQQLRKMHAEHSQVRTRVQLVRAQLRRLRTGLDHLDKLKASQRVVSEEPASEGPIVQEQPAETIEPSVPHTDQDQVQLPAGFLEALEAARDPQGKSDVVRRYFEVEAELEVNIKKEEGRSRAYFAPFAFPPMNRFYFLLDTAQITLTLTRDLKTAKVIQVHFPETDKSEPMPLKDFVKHVRKGVWLLRAKAGDDQG